MKRLSWNKNENNSAFKGMSMLAVNANKNGPTRSDEDLQEPREHKYLTVNRRRTQREQKGDRLMFHAVTLGWRFIGAGDVVISQPLREYVSRQIYSLALLHIYLV